jgi:uncharacterized protein
MSTPDTSPFYGREAELRRLTDLTRKKTASLVVIKGRRRIGKSRLAAELAVRLRGYKLLNFQGLPPTAQLTAAHEREDFALQLQRQLAIPAPRSDDWNTLLWSLADQTNVGKHLIVLDEINWLGSKDATFLGKLKGAWDNQLSKNPQLILILSGSLSGWIERNILHHTGFLGRVSLDFTLSELSLPDCNQFWGKHRDRISAHEKLRVLCVTGGVPRYLEEIDPALSADANIQKLCFTREGLLFNEFDLIFHDLFSTRDKIYRDIVTALVNGPLSLDELYTTLGVAKTGRIGDYSSDLVQAGFLSRDYTWDLKTATESKHSKIRLSDNYLRFYLKFVKPHRRRIERGTLLRLPNIDSILGLQFENIVLKNRLALFEHLRLDPNDVLYDNPYFQTPNARRRGCQVDYLIQTRQKILYICEIKFSKNVIPLAVVAQVQEKIKRISLPRHVSYQPVLIHSGEIAESIANEQYFAATINIGSLLSPSKADRSEETRRSIRSG